MTRLSILIIAACTALAFANEEGLDPSERLSDTVAATDNNSRVERQVYPGPVYTAQEPVLDQVLNNGYVQVPNSVLMNSQGNVNWQNSAGGYPIIPPPFVKKDASYGFYPQANRAPTEDFAGGKLDQVRFGLHGGFSPIKTALRLLLFSGNSPPYGGMISDIKNIFLANGYNIEKAIVAVIGVALKLPALAVKHKAILVPIAKKAIQFIKDFCGIDED